MNVMAWAVLMVTALAWPGAAHALDCHNAQTTVDMVNCAGEDLKAADKRLNAAYREQRRGADETAKALLRDAQRAWIKYRDAECERVRDGARGGTMAPLLQIGCLSALTERRAAELRGELTDQTLGGEGDEKVFWKGGKTIFETFNCKTLMQAKVGLIPGFDPKALKPTMKARIQIGPHTLDFPIGGDSQDAFCGAELSASVISGSGNCATLRVDDGMCDAFFISWHDHKDALHWFRN